MLNLIEADFNLLVEGLDYLPEKGAAGELMSSMLMRMVVKGDDEMKKVEELEKRKQQELEKGKQLLKEETKILQGKLLMLKRYMQENNLLSQAYEVINIPHQ